MKLIKRFSIYMAGTILASGAVVAEDQNGRQDARALEVLQSMSAYVATLDQVLIKAETSQDARLGEGLIVANTAEATVRIDRPSSLRISSFDGDKHREIIIHNGTLTVFNKERNFYAQASVPKEIDEALEFALEKLQIDAPMFDFLHRGSLAGLIGSEETVHYLTDGALVSGRANHQIAIRGPETDVQLWVEEGDRPVPAKFMMTSKWEGGSPRVITTMTWDSNAEFKESVFEFDPPEGSMNIGFVGKPQDGGE